MPDPRLSGTARHAVRTPSKTGAAVQTREVSPLIRAAGSSLHGLSRCFCPQCWLAPLAVPRWTGDMRWVAVILAAALLWASPARGDSTRLDWPLRPRPAVVRTFDAPAPDWNRGHRGVDLAGKPGQPVYAAGAGTDTGWPGLPARSTPRWPR